MKFVEGVALMAIAASVAIGPAWVGTGLLAVAMLALIVVQAARLVRILRWTRSGSNRRLSG